MNSFSDVAADLEPISIGIAEGAKALGIPLIEMHPNHPVALAAASAGVKVGKTLGPLAPPVDLVAFMGCSMAILTADPPVSMVPPAR